MIEHDILTQRERRSEPRIETGPFHSVEINLGPPLPIYQFGLRDISGKGMCILVREGSPILRHLEKGRIIDIKCYSMDEFKANKTRIMKAEIRHITRGEEWQPIGCCLVGVRILEEY